MMEIAEIMIVIFEFMVLILYYVQMKLSKLAWESKDPNIKRRLTKMCSSYKRKVQDL